MSPIVAPRFENGPAIHAIGLRARYRLGEDMAIPRQWQALQEIMPHLSIPQRQVAYGICFDRPDGFDYLAGIDVPPEAQASAETSKVDLPARRYAIFAHDGDAASLPRTCSAIFGDWAPRSGCELAREKDGTLVFLERYGPGFDRRTGRGDIEVWIPVW